MNERLTIAKNIKLMRKASNYTQENVASFLGIKRSTYSNYETGERELPLSCMEKLADLYGCDAYLMYEENPNVIESMLATAFRVDNLSSSDMEQIAAFKRVVKNSLMMDTMLSK
jgi:transcriptional regulator with XRE-family HTH domain